MVKKTKRIRYNFVCKCDLFDRLQNTGRTDNPLRTTTSHWLLYKKHKEKRISFDINNKAKKYEFDFDLQLIEKDGDKKYKYKKEDISREKFLSLLQITT